MTQEAAKLADADPRFPECFCKLKNDDDRQNAEALYESLRSLDFLVPAEARRPFCPAVSLGPRNAFGLIKGISKGKRFPVLDEFELPNVKFVGIAAGVLEAVRLGAVNPMLRTQFFTKIKRLTLDLSSNAITPIRQRPLNSFYRSQIPETHLLELGKLLLFKIHSVEVMVEVNERTLNILALKIIDVDFHPPLYTSFISGLSNPVR